MVEVCDSIVLSSSPPELFSSMIASVPAATGRILSPTATAPPIPTPTTIHPTWALTVWPLLTVNVFEALTDVGVIVDFWVAVRLAVVAAGSGADFGVFVDVSPDPLEFDDFCFWLLVVAVVGLTDVFGLGVGIVGSTVGTFPLLFGTILPLGGVFWVPVGEFAAMWLLCVR